MYQGRNFDHVSWLLIDDGVVDRAGSEGLLFLGRCAPLCQTLKALEGIINKYPVLVYYLAVLWHWRGRCNIKRKNKTYVLEAIGCNNDKYKRKYTYVSLISRLEIRRSSTCRRWNAPQPVWRLVFP